MNCCNIPFCRSVVEYEYFEKCSQCDKRWCHPNCFDSDKRENRYVKEFKCCRNCIEIIVKKYKKKHYPR